MKKIVWILLDDNRQVVEWESMTDGERGIEVHATRALARGAKFKEDRVCKALLTWPVRRTARRRATK